MLRQACSHDVWYYDTEKIEAGPSKAMLISHGVVFSVRVPLFGDNHRIGYLAATWDKMPEVRPADPKIMCDTADVLAYLLSKDSLHDIIKENASNEPTAYLDAYSPR